MDARRPLHCAPRLLHDAEPHVVQKTGGHCRIRASSRKWFRELGTVSVTPRAASHVGPGCRCGSRCQRLLRRSAKSSSPPCTPRASAAARTVPPGNFDEGGTEPRSPKLRSLRSRTLKSRHNTLSNAFALELHHGHDDVQLQLARGRCAVDSFAERHDATPTCCRSSINVTRVSSASVAPRS